MLNLVDLRTFVAVVDRGGFGAAARLLSYSQPAVSAHVAHLERELGGRLLDRSRSRTELTELGEQVLPQVRQVLAALDGLTGVSLREEAPPGRGHRVRSADVRAR